MVSFLQAYVFHQESGIIIFNSWQIKNWTVSKTHFSKICDKYPMPYMLFLSPLPSRLSSIKEIEPRGKKYAYRIPRSPEKFDFCGIVSIALENELTFLYVHGKQGQVHIARTHHTQPIIDLNQITKRILRWNTHGPVRMIRATFIQHTVVSKKSHFTWSIFDFPFNIPVFLGFHFSPTFDTLRISPVPPPLFCTIKAF